MAKQSKAQLPSALSLCAMAASGILTSGISYAYFYSYFRVTTGTNNRVVIAAAVAVACSLVALTGLLCRLLYRRAQVNYLFCFSIALICGCGGVINNSIASFWIDASHKQQDILRELPQRLTNLPKGSSILLGGFCSWNGPGIVFETDWDVSGALALLYRDGTITGNVVRPWMEVNDQGVQFKEGWDLYSSGSSYSFTSLYFYNVERKEASRISNREDALHNLEEFARDDAPACLAGSKGFGSGFPIW